jgi:hypothetical protein
MSIRSLADLGHQIGQARPPRGVTLVAALLVCSIPLLRTARFCRWFFAAHLLRSWDGSGHLAAADIYARTIFPDTFGWTSAWFGGMPLPNFYPPLMYWMSAAINRSGLPLLLAFKLSLALPFALIPASLGLLSWRLSSRNTLIACCTTLAACCPLLDLRLVSRFPCGLNYVSTFNEGLCTQPLGFVFLIAWVALYLSAITTWSRAAMASLTLALVILTSFFSAAAALPFAVAGLIYEARENDIGLGWSLLGAKPPVRATTLFVSALLTAFWTVPVIREYSFFVTRPLQVSVRDVIPPGPWPWAWCVAGLGGSIMILISGPSKARTFIAGSAGLLLLTMLSFFRIQHFIPSQPARFLSTFTFLLAVPVGWLPAALIRLPTRLLGRSHGTRRALLAVIVTAASLTLWAYIKLPQLDKIGDAVYPAEPSIAGVLDFGLTHREGRYIVENPWQHGDQYDSRALNAYLGMQGNETLNVVFHEASPNSVFFSPLINALSASSDSFGISAALANDLDFYNQPPERHLQRAREAGVRYIACLTPWIKRRLRQQAGLTEHAFGRWSVFEMNSPAAPEAEVLSQLPALVVSSVDLKERQSGQYSFTRLAEEQFNSTYSTVLLVRAETNKIDQLHGLRNFSALILDTYDCSDENAAFEALRNFAQQRLLVLLSSDHPLYARLAEHISELPHALLIRREKEKQREWFLKGMPWLELDEGEIRKEWKLIQAALENSKIPSLADTSPPSVSHDTGSFTVQLSRKNGANVPILVRTTFHPGWARTDGRQIYAATPFFMLTFANGPFHAKFRRTGAERAAMGVSGCAILIVALAVIIPSKILRRGPPST